MGPIRLKYILLIFIFCHHIVLTTSAITNDKLLLAAGIVTAAMMSSSDGYNSWTPSAIPLLAATVLIALTPTQSNAVSERGDSTSAANGNSGSPSQTGGSTCTASGYAIDPVLGCIKLYTFTTSPVTHSVMAAQCASDGGELLLVNSEAENTALLTFMNVNSILSVAIQGSRVTATDPWLTDAGQPLPYIANMPGTPNIAGETRLQARFNNTWFSFYPATLLINAICEIP